VWVSNKGVIGIACIRCKKSRRGCDFSLQGFGVAVPPVLFATTESAAFRDTCGMGQMVGSSESVGKGEGEEVVSVVDEEIEDIAVDEEEVAAGGERGVGDVESVGKIGDVEIVGTRTSGTSGRQALTGFAPPFVGGRTYAVFHEDVSYLEEQINNPGRTVYTLEQARIELVGAMERERLQLSTLHMLTRLRRDMWRDLSERISAEVGRLGGYPSRRDVGVGDFSVDDDAWVADEEGYQQDRGVGTSGEATRE